MTMPVFFSGDTAPDITATIHDDNDASVLADLSGETSVVFLMRKPDDRRFTVNQPADIVGDPTLGQVSYSWGANDLAVPGIYQVQWRITFPDAKVQTTLPQSIEVRRQ